MTRSIRTGCLASFLWLLGAQGAAGFPHAPEGFRDAAWGMGVDRVRRHFPGLQIREAPKSVEGFPLALETHEIAGQSVLGLNGCDVRFFFANDELYRIGFKCTGDGGLGEILRARYGEPTLEIQPTLHWTSDTRAVSFRPTTGHFSFTDRIRDGAVQVAIMKALDPAEPPVVPSPEGAPPGEPKPGRAGPRPNPPPGWLEEEGRLEGEIAALARAVTADDLAYRIGNVSLYRNPDHVAILAPHLSHEDDLVFESAAAALENIGHAQSVRALGQQIARAETPPSRKLRLIEALMFLREEPETGLELTKALSAGDPAVRQDAAMTLAVVAGPEVAPAVQRALDREHDEPTRRIFERTLEILGSRAPRSR